MRFLTVGFSMLALLALALQARADDDTTLAIGDAGPNFTAMALDGSKVTLDSYKDAEIVVLVYTCNGCPVAQAYEERIIKLADKYKGKNVKIVAINNHGGEDIAAMKKHAEENKFNFDYIYDGSGESAKSYGAKVTPHCFVLDANRKLVYQGGVDDSQKEPKENYLNDAIEATLNGKTIPVSSTKPFGCSIKFKKEKSEQK